MNVDRKEDRVVVEINAGRLVYDLDEWGEHENFLTSEGVKTFEEWQIDLMKNYGVDEDEL